MKIGAGALKGRNINFKFRTKPRPTTSLLRKAVFNIIGNDINGTCFLDLFAGSGAMGIEAFSMGAGECIFIESDLLLCRSLKENLSRYDVKGKVFVGHYKKCLRQIMNQAYCFDFIYVDPPYTKNLLCDAFNLCLKYKLLKPTGTLITEESAKGSKEIENNFSNLVLRERRKYGKTFLAFYNYAT